MDRNMILAIALSAAVYSLWLGYQASRQPPLAQQPASQYSDAMRQDGGVPGARDDARVIDESRAESTPVEAAAVEPGAEAIPVPSEPAVEPWTGRIEGQKFVAELSNRGGTLTHWMLREFNQLVRGRPADPIELVNIADAVPGSGMQSVAGALVMPFEQLGFGDLSDAVYRVDQQGPREVVFVLERGGVEIRKSYRFDLEGYEFELLVEVRNDSGRLVAPDFAIGWPAAVREGNDYKEQSLVALHADDLEREPVTGVGGAGFLGGIFGGGGEQEVWRDIHWAGVDFKYFASLLLPEAIEGTRATFEPLAVGKSAMTVLRYPASELASGQTARRRFTAFLGPKKPELLESMGRDLPRAIDLGYSWFEPLTRFFQWLLKACYQVVPNYGWSIILITILVRVLTLPIMNRQMRSMEKMRALQPRMKEIQAKYADDRQKQSEAMMAMYKETGVNPLGGCLPMLLQFPVFIGLFFALQSSFDLRQAPFILWINDLSAPDLLMTIPGLDFPLRLLPVVMGGSMILQQKLTPTTVDPSQQMMMMVLMPVMMTVLFYQFPSGLVLYWMVSNFLGIAHQLLIGRRMKTAS